MRIAIAADHHGVVAKRRLTNWLTERGHEIEDCGAETDQEVDYPPICADVGRLVAGGEVDFGIVVGGSGQGEVIACNKIRGVRAGVCHTRYATEVSRGNNDANVLVMGAKVIGVETMEEVLEIWLSTPFKQGVHTGRLEQIAQLEEDF